MSDPRSSFTGPGRPAEGGYDVELFDRFAVAEEQSFWFRSRNRLIVELMASFVRPGDRFLEIGCGTGYVLRAVVEALGVQATGADRFAQALAHARERVPAARFRQIDALTATWSAEFDVAGAFDVLEHIEDDLRALQSLSGAVRPGGHVVVTVPQHPWLWSTFDQAARHVRRYRRTELIERARQAGLTPVRLTSFVTSLLPVMAAARASQRFRRRPYDPVDQLLLPPRLDRLLERMLALERRLIRRGVNLPVGGSLVLIARREPAR